MIGVERVQRAGYGALCVTIDAAVPGQRRRELRSGLRLPLRLTPRLLAESASRPRWLVDYLRGGAGRGLQGLPPVARSKGARSSPAANTIVTADVVAHLRELWRGPLIVKGVMRAEECELILGLGDRKSVV